MAMVRILSIGNSFSVDATCYLHQTASNLGIETKVVNLYIGGCSLERHWNNIESDEKAYQYHLNGVVTERYISINEILVEETWDYIVTQQASFDSGWKDTYEPFLGLLVDYLRNKAPNSSIMLQQTWAYELDSQHKNFMRYHRNQAEMYNKLSACYFDMAHKYGLQLIPCGDIIQQLRKETPFCVQNGGISLCRDGHHMSYLYGRYLLACIWAKVLFKVSIIDNTYTPHNEQINEEANEELLLTIRMVVDKYIY